MRAHQVKLRGFRVELGEIENALSELSGVQLAAALVLQDPTGLQRLVAYITPASADPAAAKADLRERLPAHMVPDVIVPLERMPLLPNEKVDRKALPVPDWGAGAAEYVAPASELEARLQAVWQEVLGRERISAQADFFAVGGNSLQVPLCIPTLLYLMLVFLPRGHSSSFSARIWQAGKVMIRVRQAVGKDVPTAQLFRTPTIAGLARALERAGQGAEQAAIPCAGFSAEQRAAGVPCSANQAQMLVLHQMLPDSAAYNMGEAKHLSGEVSAAALQRALAYMARRHETLRTRFVDRDGAMLQAVVPARDPQAVPQLQLVSLPAGSNAADLARVVDEIINKPYQLLGVGVPLRAALISVAPTEHVFVAGMHHILRSAHPVNFITDTPCAPRVATLSVCDDELGVVRSDGVSAGIFMTELTMAYNAAKAGLAEPALPPLPIQYVDFSAWQRARLDGGELHAQREHWRRRLADAPQLLQLPTDFARPAEPSGRGDAVDVEVSPEVAAGLRALAAACGSTMCLKFDTLSQPHTP